jgi:large subunit ribosomal protein L25
MDKIELKATNRDTLGKKVRHLRREGITPIHLFGHGTQSLSLQCDTRELETVLSHAGHTGLINIKIDHEKKARMAVVRDYGRDWRNKQLVHVDFYQVRMGEKIKLDVPAVVVGEAPALRAKENMLAQELDTLHVECLPGKIPDTIKVDVSSLNEPGQAIRVKDISLDEGITILNEPELVSVKISRRHVEKMEEEPAERPQESDTDTEKSAEE